MTLRLTIGIDPGLSGAVAILADGEMVDVFDMPTVGRGKAGRQTVNAGDLAARLRAYMRSAVGAHVHAGIELVGAMPGQGVVSMFRFGQAFGAVQGVIAAMGISTEYVTPVTWKRAYGLLGTQKDASRGKASDLYPLAPLSRKRDHGRADALLIARWAWREESA